MAKKQMMLYADEQLIDRLNSLAEQFGRKSGNFVAVEILEQYADFWEAAEGARAGIIEQQRATLIETTGYYARGKGSQEEFERLKKDAQSHKPKKR
jgi:hypothetical protein